MCGIAPAKQLGAKQEKILDNHLPRQKNVKDLPLVLRPEHIVVKAFANKNGKIGQGRIIARTNVNGVSHLVPEGFRRVPELVDSDENIFVNWF